MDDIRGASGLVYRARWAASLSKAGEAGEDRYLRLEVVKGNYGPAVSPLVYVQPGLLPHNGRQNRKACGAIRAASDDDLLRLKAPEEKAEAEKQRKKQAAPPAPAAPSKAGRGTFGG